MYWTQTWVPLSEAVKSLSQCRATLGKTKQTTTKTVILNKFCCYQFAILGLGIEPTTLLYPTTL